MWHPSHFVCHFCSNTIGTQIFYEKDGRPYCEADYLNLFSPKCANCCGPILNRMLTALNKTFHPGTHILSPMINFRPEKLAISFSKSVLNVQLAWNFWTKKVFSKKMTMHSASKWKSSHFAVNCFCLYVCSLNYRECYATKLAPKCLQCSEPIIDNFISAMQAYWHGTSIFKVT